jgi:hypothetical protein
MIGDNAASETLGNDGLPRAVKIGRVFKCHKRIVFVLCLDTRWRPLKLSRPGKPPGNDAQIEIVALQRTMNGRNFREGTEEI